VDLLRESNFVRELTDTDTYKFTMMQVVLEKYMNTHVRYEFKCRNIHILNTVKDKNLFVKLLQQEVDSLCSLRFSNRELEYLSTIRYMKKGFIEILRMFQLNREHIKVYINADNDIGIRVEGPWFATILFEVPLLSIVSELYSIHRIDDNNTVTSTLINLLDEKIAYIRNLISEDLMSNLFINDMGTRRRYSYTTQWYVLTRMVNEGLLAGTSNVHFARLLGVKPMGTMAHEYICAHQQFGRVEDCQKAAFQAWADVYRGDLGIALSDTVGFDAFLKDFDLYFAKLFDGARHDSGNPYTWCNKLINHYKGFNIDPRTKVAVFSDGLTFPDIVDLFNEFHNQIKVSFGIGTNLTNDVGLTPLQIVMKMVECNGRPVAKVADSSGKAMCLDAGFESYVKSVFK
jgi:nicotinate phosphoribosyltransferase